jgi:hypothetical protein
MVGTFDWGPTLEDSSRRASEPPFRAQMDEFHCFLFRTAVLAAMFTVTLLIAYLAR